MIKFHKSKQNQKTMKTINKFMMSLLMLICVSIVISPHLMGQAGSYSSTVDMGQITGRSSVVATNTNQIRTVALSGNAYYIRFSGGENWGSSDNVNAMTAVFGAGNFTVTNFVAAVPATIFSAATGFVFMEGGNAGANELNTFLTTNITQIQNWVTAGGRLYIKAAPNVGGNINLGFGGAVLNYSAGPFSSTATATLPGHPIFAGPYTPVVTNYTGNFFAHGTLSGGAFTNIMNGNAPGCVLGGQSWGSGYVMFGTGSLVGAPGQEPATQAQNLLQNTLSFVANAATIQCSYTSSGTLIVPPGVTSGTYKLWGAGGGSGLTSGSAASGGGGGGGYTQVNRINLTPGSTFPVTIGSGGAPGSDGGFTQIEGAIASGGKSGATNGDGGFGGGQTSPFNTVPVSANFTSGFSFKGGDGGAASSPFTLGGGGGGASASATANGNNGTTSSTSSPTGGAGGATNGGNGGNQGSNGNSGTAIGGGGGGRGSGASTVGGNGAGGQFDVTWNCGTLTSISYPSPTVCSYASPLSVTIVPSTATGGTFSSSTLGAFLNSSTGAIAPGAPQGTHVITYGWAAFCTCPAQSVTFTLTIAPQAVVTAFSYAGSPYCTNAGVVSPTFTATGVAGTFTSTAGLSLNATNGAITTGTSTPGTYTVTYTVPASGNCLAVTATANVTITANPTITGFDYPGDNTYCTGEGLQTPSTTNVSNPNGNAISYSAMPNTGLSLNTTTGVINPLTSTPGVYVVTMTIAAGGGCLAVTATSTVEILARPTATIAYTGNPFCQTVASTIQPINITGVTGGPLTYGPTAFSAAPAGLTINPANGDINLNSTPGVYTVRVFFTGANGCLDSSFTSVTIKARPTSTISYSGPNPICSNISPIVGGNVVAVGPWTLTLSNGQTATGIGSGPWSITVNTMNPGDVATFTVTALIDANNCPAAAVDRPGSVTITKRNITAGNIDGVSNVRVCEGQNAIIQVNLTSSANCAPLPRFSGVFIIEYYDGVNWISTGTHSWTSNAGASTSGVNTSVSIPASLLTNPNYYTLQYRVSWVSLVDCNGCAADPLTGSVIVEVVPNPLLNVTAAPTGDVCPGTVVPFTISQAANSYVLPQHALFNWTAVATPTGGGTPFSIGMGQNVSLGNINVTTPSCPFNGTVTVTITPLNTSCCNCLYAPIIRTFVVRDVVAPNLIVAGSIPPSQTNLNLCYSAIPTGPTAAAIQALYTDNCTPTASLTVVKTGAPTGNNCEWSVTYNYLITDLCGNTSTASVTYSGGDKTAPSLTGVLPVGQTNMNLCFSAIPVGPTAAAIAALYTDNCSGNTVTAMKSGAPTGTNCSWTVTYTYVISDNCGNTTSTAITYSGGDKTAPSLTGVLPVGATNMNLCFSAIPVGPTAAAIAALYTDNCQGNTVTATKSGAPTGTNCAWTVTYTYVISDNCGNTTSTAITYSGSDKTAPSLTGTLPLGQSNMNLCFSAIPVGPTAADIAALYTDNCSGNTVTATKSGTPTGTNCAWTVTYTYVISDNCGNTTSTAITYSGGDKTAPSLTGVLPVGQTNMNLCFNAIPTGPDAATIAALYTDNCSGNTVSATKSGTPTGTNCAWSVTYTYVISDNCGNTTSTAITYSGGDKTAPSLTGTFPANVTNVNSCMDGAILPINTALVPTDAAIAALYSDNCGGAITVVRTGGLANGSTNCNWTYNYIYTISDVCGNSTTKAFSVSGKDQTAPVFSNIIPTQTLNTGAGANCSAIIPDYRGLTTVTDCGTFTVVQKAPYAPGTMVFGQGGNITVVLEATDGCGNTSSISFTVELRDLTAPNTMCKPFTLVLNASGTGSIVVANVNNGSFDNCTPTPDLIYSLSQTSFNCSNVGQNSVVLTVTDNCGNSSTCTSIVTVVDNTKPVISCWGDTTIKKDANCSYSMADLTFRVNKSDACGIASVTQSIPVGTVFGASITSVPLTLTVTDVNGNTSTCTFNITFIDVTPPTINNCPSNITVFTGPNATTCNQTATWTIPTVFDACYCCGVAAPTLVGSHLPGATFNLGTTTVTYLATDASGNTSTCSFTVTVVDNTRPVIAGCPANVSVTTGVGRTTCDQVATWTEPTATDNCTPAANLVRTRSHAPGATFPVGTTTVTYTFTDAAGNTSATCSFTVTVTDNTKPIFTSCPSNIVTTPNTAGCLAIVNTPNPTFSDNCGVTKLTWAITGAGITPVATSPTTGINYLGTRTFNFGVTTVTYTATDAAGNTATCSYTVTLNRPLAAVIAGTSTVLQNINTTSTVSFTASGGTAPYTFVYTTTNGFGAPGGTIVTTGSNSSTVGGDPNHLITTVPQSNATPGIYTYTLVSVTDALGCVVTPGTTATVTILAFNHPAPDLAPNVITQGSVNIPSANTREGYIQVSNIRVNPTTGVSEFEVYTPSNFVLTINPTTTLANGTTVQNSDFDITAYPGLGYAIKTKPGVIIGANANLKVGYTLTATGTVLTTGLYIVNIANNTGGIGITVGDDNNGNNRTQKSFKVVN
jgi:hypothetical protein